MLHSATQAVSAAGVHTSRSTGLMLSHMPALRCCTHANPPFAAAAAALHAACAGPQRSPFRQLRASVSPLPAAATPLTRPPLLHPAPLLTPAQLPGACSICDRCSPPSRTQTSKSTCTARHNPLLASRPPRPTTPHQGVVVLNLLHGGLSGQGVLDHGVLIQAGLAGRAAQGTQRSSSSASQATATYARLARTPIRHLLLPSCCRNACIWLSAPSVLFPTTVCPWSPSKPCMPPCEPWMCCRSCRSRSPGRDHP